MFRRFTLLSFLVFLFFSYNCSATHIMGGDLSYKCLGGNTYEFTLKVYRDCSGNPLVSFFGINIKSASCNINRSIIVRLEGSPQEVSPLCPAQINSSTCNGGTLPGVQQNIYKGTTQLPDDCSDYVFSWEACCRNDALGSTIQFDGNNTGMRIVANFNKQLAKCDNSPEFTSYPVPYICMNQLINYNQGGYDSDGDSLVYKIVPPLDDLATKPSIPNIIYNPPWNYDYPLTTSTGSIGFDASTGQITMFPTQQMYTVMALQIEEYRKGQLIGSTMRDIQVVVLQCNNSNPVTLGNQFENLSGGTQTGVNRVEVCPGSTLSFDAHFADSDHNNIKLSSNATTVLNGSAFTPTYFRSDSGKINITWTPTPYDTGTHVITVTVNDDACPVYGQSVYSYIIVVPKSTYAGPDISICNPGSSVLLNASGGTQYSWSPATGLSTTTGKSPTASPTVTTTYYVESDLSELCKNKDTVVVFVIPEINIDAVITPDTICAGTYVQYNCTATGGSGSGFSYQWTSSPGTFTSTDKNGSVNPTVSTTYYLKVSEAACFKQDTVSVTVKPSPDPNFNLAPSQVCQEEHVYAQYGGNISGATIQWQWDGATIATGNDPGPGPFNIFWTTTGIKTVRLTVTGSNGCMVTSTKTVTVREKPTAAFTASPLKGCEPVNVNFQNQSAGSNLTYIWRFGDGKSSTDKNPAHSYSGGIYSVTLVVESDNGCKDSVTQQDFVKIDKLPSADFTVTPESVCQRDGIATVNYSGIIAGLTFDWSWNGATVISGTGAGPYRVKWNNTGSKKIDLKVTTAAKCSSTVSKNVTVNTKPKASFTPVPSSGCDPLVVNFKNNSSSDASIFHWDFGDSHSGNEKEPVHIYPIGKYDVSLIAETPQGCKDTLLQSKVISVVAQPVASFITNAKKGVETDLSQAEFTFTNKSTGANHYKWIFGDGKTSTEENPTYKYTAVGKFEIMLVAFYDDCSDTFRFSPVIIVSYDDIFFPSAFSPNNDGKNDFFHLLQSEGVVELTLRVYNRWGQLVFETNKVDGGWDGSYNNKPQEVGVYTYFAKAKMVNGSVVEKKGSISLLR